MKFLKESVVVVHLSLQLQIVFLAGSCKYAAVIKLHCISILKSSADLTVCSQWAVNPNPQNWAKKTNQDREFLFKGTWNSVLQFNGTTQKYFGWVDRIFPNSVITEFSQIQRILNSVILNSVSFLYSLNNSSMPTGGWDPYAEVDWHKPLGGTSNAGSWRLITECTDLY